MTWRLELSGSPGPRAALLLLRGLVCADVRYLEAHPTAPHLYDVGVRYARERGEHWQDYGRLLRTLAGDCEDLACACAALLQVRGAGAIPSVAAVAALPPRQDGERAHIEWGQNGGRLRAVLERAGEWRAYPVLLRWPGVRPSADDRPPGDQYHVVVGVEVDDGRRYGWDPSRDLGMTGDA